MLLLLIFLTAIVVLAAAWVAGMYYLNDSSVPRGAIDHFKNVLVIFPHPDDETNVAGLIWQLRRRHIPVTLAVLTKGECGTPDAHLEPSLKATRTREMQRVCRILRAGGLEQADFGDGHVAERKNEVMRYASQLMKHLQPDLVISYDLAGLYGHSDHIACAEVVTDIIRKHHPGTALWYATFPRHLLKSSRLPTHMANDPHFADKRANANVRIAVGRGIVAKVRSIYAHESQRLSFQKSLPFPMPLWFAHSMRAYEYFEKVQ